MGTNELPLNGKIRVSTSVFLLSTFRNVESLICVDIAINYFDLCRVERTFN